MAEHWTPAPASGIKVGDQTRIETSTGEGRWHTITAVGSDGDSIVIYLGDRQIVYPADAQVMVRTAEDLEAVARRERERWAALTGRRIKDDSEPWYLNLINRFVS